MRRHSNGRARTTLMRPIRPPLLTGRPFACSLVMRPTIGVSRPDIASHNTLVRGHVQMDEQELVRLGIAVIRTIPDAVIFADRDGIIRFLNDGAERIFRFRADESLGQFFNIIIPERLRQRHWDGYREMMTTGISKHAADELLSVPAQNKTGDALSIQFTVAAVPDHEGGLAGIAAVLRDVTANFRELKRLRAEATGR